MLARMHLARAALVSLCLMFAGAAHAGFVSGADLLDACSPPRADPVYRLKVAECRGYVLGVADTFDCDNNVLGFTWNSSTRIGQREVVDVVVGWLSKHPDKMSYQASGLVAAALSESFSCKDITASISKADDAPAGQAAE